jgi:hypothetical protein
MLKVFKAALASAALVVSGLALAQTTPPQPEKIPPPSTQAPGASSAVQPQWQSAKSGEIRASKLIGTSVKNSAGETISDVNEVVLGSDGRVAAIVIGVGGFLGLGEREVAVNFDSLHLSNDNQKTTATLNTTKDALKAAPEWKWSANEPRTPTGAGTKPVH